MKLGEIQRVELEILLDVANFCNKNKIKYFLGCGTLCGAIVLDGFFPWDNDIDILMPRCDYEKFINTYQGKHFNLLSCNNKDYYYPYAKVISNRTIAYECKNNIPGYGVFIDVFPIDGVPNKIYLLMLKPLKYLMMAKWGCYLEKRNIFVKVVYNLLSILVIPFHNNYFAKLLNKICRRYSYKKYSKSGVVVHYRKNNEIVSSKIFEKRVKVLFEGYKFYAPRMFEEYLNCLYGDYTKEDDHHYNIHLRAYWKKG